MAIIDTIKELSPNISIAHSDEVLDKFSGIATLIVDKTDLTGDNKELAIALLTLDFVSTPDNSSITSTHIGNVSIAYSGRGTSKWRAMYDSLVNGDITNDLSILYRGI